MEKLKIILYRCLLVLLIPIVGTAGYLYSPPIYDLSSTFWTGILPVIRGGTGVATSTGTGSTVLNTNPTLVTPVLGVSDATSLRINQNTSAATSMGTAKLLQLEGADANNPYVNFLAYGGIPYISILRYNGTSASRTAIVSGNPLFEILSGGQLATMTATTGTIQFIATENFDDTHRGTKILFEGANTGAGTRSTFMQLIDGAPYFPNISTSSSATTGTLCWTTGTGLVNVDTTTTCLLSSRKYKEKIHTYSGGLSAVMAMHPVIFNYKKEYLKDDIGVQVGLIAEEVAAIDSRLVSKEADGSPHSVRYQQLTAVLIDAIKNQQKQIDDLKKQLN